MGSGISVTGAPLLIFIKYLSENIYLLTSKVERKRYIGHFTYRGFRVFRYILHQF